MCDNSTRNAFEHRDLLYRGLLFGVIASSFVCAPAMAHQGEHNRDARDACIEQTLGNACEWTDGQDALYVGSCRQVSSSLLCVRNKPIIHSDEHNQEVHK